MPADTLTVALCGDVMLGRGVDQILPNPGDPRLREQWITDARDYVRLAERANGPVPVPVEPSWPWGDAQGALDGATPDARVINLETAVTSSDDFAPGKGIHYRMAPGNVSAILAASPDVCVLANNHVLDFGVSGLAETLAVLDEAGVRTAGAGRDLAGAWRPAITPVAGGGRVLVFAVGMPSSGVPADWAAGPHRPGVAYLDDASAAAASHIAAQVDAHRRARDLVVVSIHWGSNWGYEVPHQHTDFAHALVDGGVDVVFGHSSHHPRPVEIYRGRPILYGCGDLINDYEGIRGHERYRSELRVLYLASLSAEDGALVGLRMVPFRARRLRLERASPQDTAWLRTTLQRVSRRHGTIIDLRPDGDLAARQKP